MKKIYNKFKHSLVKNKFYNVLTPILIVIFLVSGYKLISHKSPVNKAELAYIDHSPIGETGGSVMPASCDSYPAHSTCECTSGATTNVECTVTSGLGSQTKTCIVSGNNLVWNPGACIITSCNPGFDLVTDSAGTRCETSCTGNQYRIITSPTETFACARWVTRPSLCGGMICENDCGYYSVPPAPNATRTYCCEGITSSSGNTASCAACPNGTVPNANHTSCSAPATPSVNVNLGN